MTYTTKIEASGYYLPQRKVTAAEIDHRLGKPAGWAEAKHGLSCRYYAEEESAISMAATAVHRALKRSKIEITEIDTIVGASGVTHQPIPCSAALLQKELGLGKSGIPCFDINATCLGSITALEVAAQRIELGLSRRVLIFTADKASVGIDWTKGYLAPLFGDGAAAWILSQGDATSQIDYISMATFGDYASAAQLRSGGTAVKFDEKQLDEFAAGSLFEMDGKALFRLVLEKMPDFLDELFERSGTSLNDIDCIIPHQASRHGLDHLLKYFGVGREKVIDIFAEFGNQIATSIPTALAVGVEKGRINRGDRLLLIGTGAGLSLSGAVLRY